MCGETENRTACRRPATRPGASTVGASSRGGAVPVCGPGSQSSMLRDIPTLPLVNSQLRCLVDHSGLHAGCRPSNPSPHFEQRGTGDEKPRFGLEASAVFRLEIDQRARDQAGTGCPRIHKHAHEFRIHVRGNLRQIFGRLPGSAILTVALAVPNEPEMNITLNQPFVRVWYQETGDLVLSASERARAPLPPTSGGQRLHRGACSASAGALSIRPGRAGRLDLC